LPEIKKKLEDFGGWSGWGKEADFISYLRTSALHLDLQPTTTTWEG